MGWLVILNMVFTWLLAQLNYSVTHQLAIRNFTCGEVNSYCQDPGGVSSTMKGEAKERWMRLCEQAALEQDPEKLMQLVVEINRLLEEKEQRLIRTSQQQPES